MNRSTVWPFTLALGLLALPFALAACGGGGGGSPAPSEAAIRTLAYVVTNDTCIVDRAEAVLRQELRIRQADRQPVTALQFPPIGPLPDALGLCSLLGRLRIGEVGVAAGVFQRLGVSRDGSTVVFEVADDFSLFRRFGAGSLVSEDQKGMFLVHADGSGLQRLGDASQDACFRVVADFTSPVGFRASFNTQINFSPNGRAIVFSDRGPDPEGEDAVQVVTVDVVTGKRTQVTHLPPAPGLDPAAIPIGPLFFLDDETIVFATNNPDGSFTYFLVKADGSDLPQELKVIAPPGGHIVEIPEITGEEPAAAGVQVPGVPVNGPGAIFEAFVFDRDQALQLTNFRRVDTANARLSADKQRVFFVASADPFRENPFENCQIFSIDRLATDLRQLTHFGEGEHSRDGCSAVLPPGCRMYGLGVDSVTATVLFYTSCNLSGTQSNGGQIFAMRPDGTGLRALTDTRGFVTEADGTRTVELAGPWASTVRR
ncbi:MAG: hypothetical protein LAO77_18680 [Acidobacteriia bacterium]|nr:hypothetical protein [Terriglobia bacterium]